MITSGIDAGSETLKVAILRDGELIGSAYVTAGSEPTAVVAQRVFAETCERAGIGVGDIERIVATGFGSNDISFSTELATEAASAAMGVNWASPSAHVALDIGGLKCLAVRCRDGKPLKISTNEKCAAGSGKFLRVVAALMRLPVEEIGTISLRSSDAVTVHSTCSVFAESELISLIHLKKKPEDILKGVFRGLASRIYTLLLTAGIEDDVYMIGGVARNAGMVKVLEETTGHPIKVPPQPELMAAVGAALLGQERRVDA